MFGVNSLPIGLKVRRVSFNLNFRWSSESDNLVVFSKRFHPTSRMVVSCSDTHTFKDEFHSHWPEILKKRGDELWDNLWSSILNARNPSTRLGVFPKNGEPQQAEILCEVYSWFYWMLKGTLNELLQYLWGNLYSSGLWANWWIWRSEWEMWV